MSVFLHSAFRFSIMEVGLQHCNTTREVGTIQQFSEGGALALRYGTAVPATIFMMQGCYIATYLF